MEGTFSNLCNFLEQAFEVPKQYSPLQLVGLRLTAVCSCTLRMMLGQTGVDPLDGTQLEEYLSTAAPTVWMCKS